MSDPLAWKHISWDRDLRIEEWPFHTPKRWNPWTKNGRGELGDMVNICMNWLWLMFDSLPNDFPRFHQQVACAIYSLYAYIFGWWFHFLDFHPCGNDAIWRAGFSNGLVQVQPPTSYWLIEFLKLYTLENVTWNLKITQKLKSGNIIWTKPPCL